MLQTVYLNGQYLPREEASLHVSDLSILRGYGVFDYFRYVEGKPRFIADHIARFRSSADALHLSLDISDSELTEVVHELIERNTVANGGIRFILTGGYAADGYTPAAPNLLALPYPFSDPAAIWYKHGCTVLLHNYERQLPRAKTIDYIEGIRLLPQLKKTGAQYPFYVDRQGMVRESDRSNFMIIREKTLVTPKDDILLGITRKHLLVVAKHLGIPTHERAVSTSELLDADEVLICSSVKGAMPVRAVLGGEHYADQTYGEPGPITRRLMAGWRQYV